MNGRKRDNKTKDSWKIIHEYGKEPWTKESRPKNPERIEHGTVTPLVMSANGCFGREYRKFHARLP